jgi:hypothetical protein
VGHNEEIDQMITGASRRPDGERFNYEDIQNFYHARYPGILHAGQISRHKRDHLNPEIDRIGAIKIQVDEMFKGVNRGKGSYDPFNLQSLQKAFTKTSIMLLLSINESDVKDMKPEERLSFAQRFSGVAMDIDRIGRHEMLQKFEKLLGDLEVASSKVTVRKAGDIIDEHLSHMMGDDDGKVSTVPLPETVDSGTEPVRDVDGLPPDSGEVIQHDTGQRKRRIKA